MRILYNGKQTLYSWCNKNTKANGDNYTIYTDGLKIYTTIDSRMQKYAEEAVIEHLGDYLQPRFFNEKKKKSYAPYSRHLTTEEVNNSLKRAMKQSERYRKLKAAGVENNEMKKYLIQKSK
jgi:penicillin-binding protein 1A